MHGTREGSGHNNVAPNEQPCSKVYVAWYCAKAKLEENEENAGECAEAVVRLALVAPRAHITQARSTQHQDELGPEIVAEVGDTASLAGLRARRNTGQCQRRHAVRGFAQ